MSKNKKEAAVFTIGCRLNQADTALMYDRLEKNGFNIADIDSPGRKDLIVINTCAVTANAVKKSRQTVRKYRKLYPESIIVVAGCGPEVEKPLWENEDSADILIGNSQKKNIIEILNEYSGNKAQKSFTSALPGDEFVFSEESQGVHPFRHRAFLKVQEGCNSFCSYCIVPYARGRERSREWNEIVSEFKKLIRDGFKEIVITGVNTSVYKCGGKSLADLIAELASFEGDFRIRVGSTEPHPHGENLKLIKLMKESDGKICRFMHLPLQHGTDEILKLMNRKYTVAEYFDFVIQARELLSLIHIGTDVIVGFPGESDKLFSQSAEFIEKVSFANTHIFPFSPRKGTPAFDFSGKVKPETVRMRFEELEKIARQSAVSYAERNLKTKLKVLIETCSPDGNCEGWSDNYLRAKIMTGSLRENDFAEFVFHGVNGDGILSI